MTVLAVKKLIMHTVAWNSLGLYSSYGEHLMSAAAMKLPHSNYSNLNGSSLTNSTSHSIRFALALIIEDLS